MGQTEYDAMIKRQRTSNKKWRREHLSPAVDREIGSIDELDVRDDTKMQERIQRLKDLAIKQGVDPEDLKLMDGNFQDKQELMRKYNVYGWGEGERYSTTPTE